MFILKKGHQPGVYVPLRALFLVSGVGILWNFMVLQQYVTRLVCFFASES